MQVVGARGSGELPLVDGAARGNERDDGGAARVEAVGAELLARRQLSAGQELLEPSLDGRGSQERRDAFYRLRPHDAQPICRHAPTSRNSFQRDEAGVIELGVDLLNQLRRRG